MPRQRYERREPTHDWQQLRPLLKDPTQLTYEIIRPVILGWETPTASRRNMYAAKECVRKEGYVHVDNLSRHSC